MLVVPEIVGTTYHLTKKQLNAFKSRPPLYLDCDSRDHQRRRSDGDQHRCRVDLVTRRRVGFRSRDTVEEREPT